MNNLKLILGNTIFFKVVKKEKILKKEERGYSVSERGNIHVWKIETNHSIIEITIESFLTGKSERDIDGIT